MMNYNEASAYFRKQLKVFNLRKEIEPETITPDEDYLFGVILSILAKAEAKMIIKDVKGNLEK